MSPGCYLRLQTSRGQKLEDTMCNVKSLVSECCMGYTENGQRDREGKKGEDRTSMRS
jgi:hypothetical protein